MSVRFDNVCCLITLAVVSIMLLGCDSEPTVDRYPVSGEVTLDKRPVSSATIRFISNQRNRDAVTIVENGMFQIQRDNGLAPGDYDVIVTPNNPELTVAIAAIEAGERDPLNARTIPAKYQRAGFLHATVVADSDNQCRFELTTR
ncbi:MAG: carboxypeptidase regulatory-like domain-containing protein [Rhodopirellula sp. JB044]|uniref:carboxypeptidase regulatory-like domain-containing protein n=1 Tax=Rhodopirellula sp. JB044 TaxID=3342844 RepID=UPI00370A5E6A